MLPGRRSVARRRRRHVFLLRAPTINSCRRATLRGAQPRLRSRAPHAVTRRAGMRRFSKQQRRLLTQLQCLSCRYADICYLYAARAPVVGCCRLLATQRMSHAILTTATERQSAAHARPSPARPPAYHAIDRALSYAIVDTSRQEVAAPKVERMPPAAACPSAFSPDKPPRSCLS